MILMFSSIFKIKVVVSQKYSSHQHTNNNDKNKDSTKAGFLRIGSA